MPFADYDDFGHCVRANSDKRNPEAYCGAIKHQVEKMNGATLPEPVPLSEAPLEVYELEFLAMETKIWMPYEGPQGGEGWQNTETGEVVYQDEKPGEDESDDASDDVDDVSFDNAAPIDYSPGAAR